MPKTITEIKEAAAALKEELYAYIDHPSSECCKDCDANSKDAMCELLACLDAIEDCF